MMKMAGERPAFAMKPCSGSYDLPIARKWFCEDIARRGTHTGALPTVKSMFGCSRTLPISDALGSQL